MFVSEDEGGAIVVIIEILFSSTILCGFIVYMYCYLLLSHYWLALLTWRKSNACGLEGKTGLWLLWGRARTLLFCG